MAGSEAFPALVETTYKVHPLRNDTTWPKESPFGKADSHYSLFQCRQHWHDTSQWHVHTKMGVGSQDCWLRILDWGPWCCTEAFPHELYLLHVECHRWYNECAWSCGHRFCHAWAEHFANCQHCRSWYFLEEGCCCWFLGMKFLSGDEADVLLILEWSSKDF